MHLYVPKSLARQDVNRGASEILAFLLMNPGQIETESRLRELQQSWYPTQIGGANIRELASRCLTMAKTESARDSSCQRIAHNKRLGCERKQSNLAHPRKRPRA